MPVLEERGRFWWEDMPVPEGHFAPEESITGMLTIDNDGRIALDLDDYFPNKHGPWGLLAQQGAPITKNLCGILRTSNRRVVLIGVINDGGKVQSAGISYQRFIATDCLVGNLTVLSDQSLPTFDRMEIDLSGLEAWFWFRSITVSLSGDDQITAEYKRPETVKYELEDGTLHFEFDAVGSIPFNGLTDEIAMKEKASAIFQPAKRETLEQLRDRFRFLEDLLILLTDSEYQLTWPVIQLDTSNKFTWYFTRLKNESSVDPPKRHECLTHFPRLRDSFGSIWSSWKRKREEFGPGFYLYLGTRRGFSLYEEHRFVNLIWGIEAFHRTKYPANPDEMKTRIENIVAQISEPNDKKLVKRGLKYAHEPRLEERIFSTFKDLPIGIESSRLRKFAKSCADARNDISHFGARRHDSVYSDFVLELAKKSRALSTLYHCLLLQEIGVNAEIIRNWTSKGWRSFRIKYSFVEVGLLAEEVLKPDIPKGLK